jgi:hypothetical protein
MHVNIKIFASVMHEHACLHVAATSNHKCCFSAAFVIRLRSMIKLGTFATRGVTLTPSDLIVVHLDGTVLSSDLV